MLLTLCLLLELVLWMISLIFVNLSEPMWIWFVGELARMHVLGQNFFIRVVDMEEVVFRKMWKRWFIQGKSMVMTWKWLKRWKKWMSIRRMLCLRNSSRFLMVIWKVKQLPYGGCLSNRKRMICVKHRLWLS